MSKLEKQVHEVLHNLNWLMGPHGSFVELIEVTDKRVVIRSVGYCTYCKTDCVGATFKERMPDIELIIQ